MRDPCGFEHEREQFEPCEWSREPHQVLGIDVREEGDGQVVVIQAYDPACCRRLCLFHGLEDSCEFAVATGEVGASEDLPTSNPIPGFDEEGARERAVVYSHAYTF